MARFIDTNIFVACLRGRADHLREIFLRHPPGEILVTNNSDEFSRVPGLMHEDWLKS